MGNTTQNRASGGTSIFSLLAVAFIVMKFAGIGAVANWSWWWVLSPLWLPMAIVLGLLVLFGIGFLIYWLVTK